MALPPGDVSLELGQDPPEQLPCSPRRRSTELGLAPGADRREGSTGGMWGVLLPHAPGGLPAG